MLCFISAVHQDVAQNMAALFQKAFTDPLRFGQAAGTEEGVALMSPVDLATELVSGTDSCEELAHHAYAFFEASGFGVVRLLRQARPVILVRTKQGALPTYVLVFKLLLSIDFILDRVDTV